MKSLKDSNMESRLLAGAASWPLIKNVFRILLLLGCGGVRSNSVSSFIARPTKWLHKTPLLHKVSRVQPPAHPWAASGFSERVISAGSVTGALFHAFVDPVLGKAPILNTTELTWTPLELWGAGKAGSNNLLAMMHDPLTDELEKEVKMESEHHGNPNMTKAHLVANPKVSVGLSHASSSRVRSPGSAADSSKAISSDLQDAEFELMGQLLRDATNFFAFEGSLLQSAVGLENLHHIHVIEANAQTLDNLMEKTEIQSAIHAGRLVLTGQPAAQDSVFNSPACLPGEVQAAFEADWDLIFLGKECSADAVMGILEAASSKTRVAVLELGTLPNHTVLDSCDKVRTAGSLSVFVRKDGEIVSAPHSENPSEAEESGISLEDVVAPLAHGEGLWPH